MTERIVAYLAASKGKYGGWVRIAAVSGLPYQTVRRIATGEIANPRMADLQAIDSCRKADKLVDLVQQGRG